jgi:uracil-DNA glycosylase
MSQKSIKSFFKPVVPQNTKRCASGDASESVQKKIKVARADNEHLPLSDLSTKLMKQIAITPLLTTNFGSSWFKALEAEFDKAYFKKLSSFLVNERSKATVFPPADQVFSWTVLCRIQDIKVVILGQDPYHQAGQAHGLCFSVPRGVRPPPSLVNIFKELSSDIPGFIKPAHGDLTGWAEQGVLLLNACLTVRSGNANSHADQGWENFTDAVIKWLNANSKGIVFLLWGSYAQKKGSFIDKKKHTILTSVHPSPLSAHRGFLGCKHFSQTNDTLKKNGKPMIDWNHLP